VADSARQAVDAEPLYWSAVEPHGRHVVLTGAAPDEQTRERAAARVAMAGGVAGVANYIAVVAGPTGACQHDVDAILRASPVLFRPGRPELHDASLPVLEAVAAALHGCAGRFEVASHTDDRGDAAVNRTLSQRRAEVVVRHLILAGVAERRLRAAGYGEAQPLADNRTEAGRAANRRLELRVLGSEA
jgi:outer membrane protein OmpA-like peptidoglycan-associated protein